MIGPKRRSSKARTRTRRANWKLTAPNLVECPHCHEYKLPHRVCGACQQYKGREVFATSEE